MTKLQFSFDHALDKLGPFEAHPHVAVAVSGGSDSMALALLTQKWIETRRGQLICLVVDHGLRVESHQEALHVQETLSAHQIPCEIISWTSTKPQGRVQEQARRARYALLEQWCYKHHILHLLVGHHQDDQRETYQLRQDKNSTLLGLSGMSAVFETRQIRILRPLLTFSKSQLRTFLHTRHTSFIEDPSNTNSQFTRSILRQRCLDHVEKSRIHQACQSHGQYRIQRENYINDLVCCCVSLDAQGYGILNTEFFQKTSSEDQLSILQRCLMTFGHGEYPPAQTSLKALNQRLQQSSLTPQTLHGCIVFSHKTQIYFAREPEAIKSVSFSTSSGALWWDERFRLKFVGVDKNEIIAPLTSHGWCQLKQRTKLQSQYHDLKHLPAFVRFGLPSLWRDDQCLGVCLPNLCMKIAMPEKSLHSEFTTKAVYDIYFAPRYPLTRFTFVIV